MTNQNFFNKAYWKVVFQIRKLKKIKLKISVIPPLFQTIASFGKQKQSAKLVIIDDIFPHRLSAFRICEFNHYLKIFPDSNVYSTATAFKIINEDTSFEEILNEYESIFPELSRRVFKMPDYFIFQLGKIYCKFFLIRPFECKLAYFVFLGNAYTHLSLIEKFRIPFVFTLYPGGAFQLNQSASDIMLRRVCSSPYLKKVIVTQPITRKYLQENNLVENDKIEFIYGGVFPSEFYAENELEKKYFPDDKKTIDICFVAHKYTRLGEDKGYDIFVDVVKFFSLNRCINFHVVGDFDENVIDITEVKEKITFYGKQRTDFFPSFYSKMDIILSPNRPFVLGPGGFDGFPTGCCVEAALCGVAVFCTDILDQNMYFENRKDIVIIKPIASSIVNIIQYYLDNANDLYSLSRNGQAKFADIFSFKSQLSPRVKIIQDLIDN